MTFAAGSIVEARGRQWIVRAGSTEDLLLVQPINGRPEEATGILTKYEKVREASFELPMKELVGDSHDARILQLASRIANRNSPAPFRSISRVSVDPRPYQVVPLMLALRQDPIRILIADDVGVGKTIEALLIAREMLDRGEIERFCVLCPPHLAEQWKRELDEKFHIDAQLLLSTTAKRLERDIPHTVSVFQAFPFLVVSLDYIKTENRRQEFLNRAPELVIIDEAHTCTKSQSTADHQRYEVVRQLSEAPTDTPTGRKKRHIILVTATPHTGKEGSFKRLLGILDSDLEQIPEDLSGATHKKWRERVAEFMVQRRRKDIRRYLEDHDAPFPERDTGRIEYALSPTQVDALASIIEVARAQSRGGEQRERVAVFALMGILRAFASSPIAAAETLKNRFVAEAIDEDSILDDSELEAPRDVVPSGDFAPDNAFAVLAEKLSQISPNADPKLKVLSNVLTDFKKDKRNTIVFCHFIPTAEYVANALSAKFPDHAVGWVSGKNTPHEREGIIRALMDKPSPRVLVATDCISEGVNLQEGFDAVVHYDLAWTPTRHEQREGRVDRYLQQRKRVPCVTIWSPNTLIDDIVLEILLTKQLEIKKKTGVVVPAPAELKGLQHAALSRQVIRSGKDPRAVIQHGLALQPGPKQTRLIPLEEAQQAQLSDAYVQWEQASERERSSQATIFAQETIKKEIVMETVDRILRDTARPEEVEQFMTRVIHEYKGRAKKRDKHYDFDFTDLDPVIRYRLPERYRNTWKGSFTVMDEENSVHIPRTHPVAEAFAQYVIDSALDPVEHTSAARRVGCIATDLVTKQTTIYLVRHRFNLDQGTRASARVGIIEDIHPHAFAGKEELLPEATSKLLDARPTDNVDHEVKKRLLDKALQSTPWDALRAYQKQRAKEVQEGFETVRNNAKLLGGKYDITPQGEPDVIGVYVFVPAIGGEA